MNECKIVQDLLPLYVEELVSEETGGFIRGHLQSCESCRKIRERLGAPIPVEPQDAADYKRSLKKDKVLLGAKWAVLGILIAFLLAVGFNKITELEVFNKYFNNGMEPVELTAVSPNNMGTVTLVDLDESGMTHWGEHGTIIWTEMKTPNTQFDEDGNFLGSGVTVTKGAQTKPWENVQVEWAPNSEEVFFSAELLTGGTGFFVLDYQCRQETEEEGFFSESRLLPMDDAHGYLNIMVEGCRNHTAFPTGWETVSFSFHKWQEDSETITFVYETDNGFRGLVDFHYPSETVTNVD